LRKAALHGAAVSFVNPVDYAFQFPVAHSVTADPGGLLAELAALAAAAGAVLPLRVHQPEPGDEHKAIARELRRGERSAVLLGALAQAHPAYGMLQFLARAIAQASGAAFGILPPAANSVGAVLAGVLPHRMPGGGDAETPGRDARAMFEQPCRGYLLLGIEPRRDCWDPATAMAALGAADCVVALSAYASDDLLEIADVLLPVAGFAETSGTHVNLAGTWQSWDGAVSPPGEARPGWKVLRVLGNQLDLDGFEYTDSRQVHAAVRAACADLTPDNAPAIEPAPGETSAAVNGALWRVGEVPAYAGDPLVRRAAALQRTPDAVAACIRLAPADAERLGLAGVATAVAVQGDSRVTLPLEIDARVAVGSAWIPAGVAGTCDGPACGPVHVEKA
jgi:NADH-quinone oxidoreductase subunit G